MVKLIGIPYDKNSSFIQGAALGPNAIRRMETQGSANSYTEELIEIAAGVSYEDIGNLELQNSDSPEAFTAIFAHIKNEIKDAKICTLGGDHSISYPIIKAHASKYPNLQVLQIDAHGDLYENFNDNPYSHASPFARLLEDNCIGGLIQVGIRSLTPHQQTQVEKYGVQSISMRDFNYDFIKDLQGPLYISLDLDGLDPAYAPGVAHHEPGGLSSRQVLQIIQNIKVDIVGADIVELNPKRDINDMTAMVAYKCMKEIIAKMI